MHKVQIVDRQHGDDPHVTVSLDDRLVEGVYSYSIQGALGEIPRVTISITAEDIEISSGPNNLERPF